MTKTCSCCGQKKASADFYASRLRCKVCMRAESAAWRDSNPGRNAAAARKWRRCNPERAITSGSNWRRENPELARQKEMERYRRDPSKRAVHQAKWNKGNRASLRAADRRYGQKHPHIIRQKAMRRHASKRNAIPVWADLGVIKAIYKRAVELTQQTGVEHQADHIVPLRHLRVCGLHCETNLQVLTRAANLEKSNRYWPDMPPEDS